MFSKNYVILATVVFFLVLGGLLFFKEGGFLPLAKISVFPYKPGTIQQFSLLCKVGPNPFPSEMGDYKTWPAKEGDPARLEVLVNGGSGNFSYYWFRIGGSYQGNVGSKDQPVFFGSGNPYIFTLSNNSYGAWKFKAVVKDNSLGVRREIECPDLFVVPNPPERLNPRGEKATVNPVLWVPKGAFENDIVPSSAVNQLKRALKHIRSEYYKIYGKTFRMNDLKVVVSNYSEEDICGGDCVDLGKVDLLVSKAIQESKQRVGGCFDNTFACVPFNKEIMILAWGAGGYAGGGGPDNSIAVVGDWALATAMGLEVPKVESEIDWQKWDMGKYLTAVKTLAHELGHNIAWDDPHDFYLTPQNPYEIGIALSFPWLSDNMTDTSPPKFSVKFPNTEFVSGKITLNISASDYGSGLDAAVLTIDDYFYALDDSYPFSFQVDTRKLGYGPRKFSVIVYDRSGNFDIKEQVLNIRNVISTSICPDNYPLDSGIVCYWNGIGTGGNFLGALIDAPYPIVSENMGWWPNHDFGMGEISFGEYDTITGVWYGRLYFPPARYKFNVETDDGIRIYVNDVLILDEWNNQSARFEPEVDISGYANIKIEWYENYGAAKLKILWQPIGELPSLQPPCDSYGDVDGDRDVDSVDALKIKRYAAGLEDLTPQQKERADVNNDGKVDSADSLLILRYVSGLESTFPVCEVDSTPPTVSIINPKPEDILSGTVDLRAIASDNKGIAKVEFYYNSYTAIGILIGEDSTSPYSVKWDTSKVKDGSYTIQAKAYDTSHNFAFSKRVKVTVRNKSFQPPSLQPPCDSYGDVDGDGDVDSVDSLKIQRYVSGLEDLTPQQKERADVNNDGKVDSADSLLILRYVRGLESTFPVCEASVGQSQDSDNDGFSDEAELSIGTDPFDACPDDPNDNAWPIDLNNDRKINILDVTLFSGPIFNSTKGDPNYDPRYDLDLNGVVNLVDVMFLVRAFNQICSD